MKTLFLILGMVLIATPYKGNSAQAEPTTDFRYNPNQLVLNLQIGPQCGRGTEKECPQVNVTYNGTPGKAGGGWTPNKGKVSCGHLGVGLPCKGVPT